SVRHVGRGRSGLRDSREPERREREHDACDRSAHRAPPMAAALSAGEGGEVGAPTPAPSGGRSRLCRRNAASTMAIRFSIPAIAPNKRPRSCIRPTLRTSGGYAGETVCPFFSVALGTPCAETVIGTDSCVLGSRYSLGFAVRNRRC